MSRVIAAAGGGLICTARDAAGVSYERGTRLGVVVIVAGLLLAFGDIG